MIKKITALLTATAIVLSAVPVFAKEDALEAVPVHKMDVNEITEIKLSLQEAVAVALENNPRINAADASIKSATLSLEVVEETQKDFDKLAKYASVPVVISQGLDTAYLKHGYYPAAARVGLELAEISKEQVTAAISYEVTEKYYNVKLMEELVNIAKTGLGLAQDNLTLMENQLEAGYVSALEVKNAQNAVTQAENSVKSYERNLELAVRSFKISLQLDNTACNVVLTDEIAVPELPEADKELIAAAVNTRYDMTAARKDFELKEMMFDIAKKYVTDKMAMYHTVYSDYMNSKYTYDNAVKMIGIALESEYASILSAYDAIKAAENDLDVKQNVYDSKKTMYDLGLITNLELTSAMADYDSAKMQLENSRVTYALAVIKFGYSTTIGI